MQSSQVLALGQILKQIAARLRIARVSEAAPWLPLDAYRAACKIYL